MSLNVHLSPNDQADLGRVYRTALKEARELFVASAYLTHWDAGVRLHKQCSRVVFVVGTDFGITRKAALRAVLKWLPTKGAVTFGAVASPPAGGFHPKMLLWKTADGRCRCVIGSSNLSKAAFASNYEANVSAKISASEYSRLSAWISAIADESAPISEDWIANHYREATRPAGRVKGGLWTPMRLKLPTSHRCAVRVRERRRAQALFQEIADTLRTAMRRCASGRMSNSAFWRRFWKTWSTHDSRFQGAGLEISGKNADWREACASLIRILDSAEAAEGRAVDPLVSLEIDRLQRNGNPVRGAWLSEMLCHYLPEHYPLFNEPIKAWLKLNKWRGRRGATEGQRYIELARKLRVAVRSKPAGSRNLAELDLAIWQWVADHPETK